MPRVAAIGMVLVIGLGVGLRTAQYAAGTFRRSPPCRLPSARRWSGFGGGNAKPYAVDVAATLLLVWLVLPFDEQADDPWIGRFGAVPGAVAILASFAAIPTAATLILVLAWRSRRVAYPPASLLRLAGPWIGAAILVFAWTFYTVDPATRAQMSRYWVHGFPPAPWQGGRS